MNGRRSSFTTMATSSLGAVATWLILAAFLHVAAPGPGVPEVRAAPPSQSSALHPVHEFGGQIVAVALSGDLAFVVVGRRVQVHDFSAPQGDTLVGESDPVTLPVLEAELLGEHVVLLTGAPGANGAL
jgi:hypothetical protein